MLNDTELTAAIDATTAPRVTKEGIESRIKGTEFLKIGETVTLANITLDNGFSVRGKSACVNAANYRQEICEKIAYDNAFKQLWAFFGFALAENCPPQQKGNEMFEALGNLIGGVVKTAVNVVEIPLTIVNTVVVKPVSEAVEAVADEIKDLCD